MSYTEDVEKEVILGLLQIELENARLLCNKWNELHVSEPSEWHDRQYSQALGFWNGLMRAVEITRD